MKMFSSICSINVHITKFPILSCLPSQHNKSSSSSSENTSPPPPGSKRKPPEAKIPASSSPPLQKKPSVAEIERAIGAGVFRDRNLDGDSEEGKTLFDTILSNSIGKSEGSVEKKLRETGEWILDKTEGSSSRSAGKNILKTVFLLILPLWIISFLVAAGFVKLPFNTPFLDDWIL
ncbi:Chlororespiratory reduction 3 [Heracleum sosnowskyi]|uniref:Chlororespiratory reduction 3 n=1 Tax=Heracleum sosnowskyi TaxID=360622 RepID=A0AAD8I8U8_9APIA|nr:Chlororespiratory reduction 3 [Heracleum sosnowskyi]